jgi:hypothetical protein
VHEIPHWAIRSALGVPLNAAQVKKKAADSVSHAFRNEFMHKEYALQQ